MEDADEVEVGPPGGAGPASGGRGDNDGRCFPGSHSDDFTIRMAPTPIRVIPMIAPGAPIPEAMHAVAIIAPTEASAIPANRTLFCLIQLPSSFKVPGDLLACRELATDSREGIIVEVAVSVSTDGGGDPPAEGPTLPVLERSGAEDGSEKTREVSLPVLSIDFRPPAVS